MEVSIDDDGRIVIPKSVRDRLDLQSGTSLELTVQCEGDNGELIALTPKRRDSPLEQKGALLVHTGELSEDRFDVAEHLREQRRTRASKHAGNET